MTEASRDRRSLVAEIHQLERELSACKKDAEDAKRYRWIRDTDSAVLAWMDEDGKHWSITGRHHNITKGELDAAIDSAMKEKP